MLRRSSGSVVAAGEAGEAAAEGIVEGQGPRRVWAAHIAYNGAPETTKVVLSDKTTGAAVLTVTGNEDAVFYPRVPASKAADGSASELTEVEPLTSTLQVAISASDPGATVSVAVFTVE